MTRRSSCALALAVTLVAPSGALAAHFPRLAERPPAIPGEVLVVLPPGASFAPAGEGLAPSTDALRTAAIARAGLAPARVLGSGPAGRSRGVSALGGRFALLRPTHDGVDAAAASAALRASGLFTAACPNVTLRLFDTLPNDPYRPDQWYVQDVGGSDIRLPAAWDIGQGSASVVIAILDSGIDTGHPDLASQIWQNPGEIAGNGLDDDGNGYVDDVEGWDFGDGDADPNPTALIDEIGLDVGFHGTFCAGIASAATDNGVGISGAGWNCRLMAIRLYDSSGNATTEGITDAVAYAVDNGADVISMSFGAADAPGIPEFFQALMDAATAAGVVCVAAAGNDGVDLPLNYPAACDHVISVGATTDTNERADFSNWGPTVDVAAPGSFMWSTICRNYEVDEISQIFYIYFFLWDGTNPYMYGDGTSFACPLVAGVCGLVRARWPALTPDQVATHLVATGDVVAYDLPIGPRVNAWRALNNPLVGVGDRQEDGGLRLGGPVPNPSPAGSRMSFTLAEPGEVELDVFDAGGRRVRSLDRATLPAGRHEAFWDGVDDLGRETPAGLYFIRLRQGGASRTTRIVRLAR